MRDFKIRFKKRVGKSHHHRAIKHFRSAQYSMRSTERLQLIVNTAFGTQACGYRQ
jgi:hypothetical protein